MCDKGGQKVRTRGRRGGVGVERGVGRGGTGGILMGKSGRIGDIDRGIDRGRERDRKVIGGIGQERNTRIGESAPEAMRGEERIIGRGAGLGSAVILLDYIDGEGMSEIESMIIDDEGIDVMFEYGHGQCSVRLSWGVCHARFPHEESRTPLFLPTPGSARFFYQRISMPG